MCSGGRLVPSGPSPSSDPSLLVLVSLAAGPRHGHAILRDVEEFAGVRLGPGTLYGAISRLEDDGLIEALPPDRRRRPYRLTVAGRDSLDRRLARLAAAVRTGQLRVASR
jgi:DNA-binding PadR family transcriptional regulator